MQPFGAYTYLNTIVRDLTYINSISYFPVYSFRSHFPGDVLNTS